jgi:hypothetical protein
MMPASSSLGWGLTLHLEIKYVCMFLENVGNGKEVVCRVYIFIILRKVFELWRACKLVRMLAS